VPLRPALELFVWVSFLISSSQIARITDVSHLHLALNHFFKKENRARHGCFTPASLATQEAEIRRISV
jgi:hypothetical protein